MEGEEPCTNPYTPWIDMNVRTVREGEEQKATPWANMKTKKLYTNVFIWDEEEGKLLLGYKKRGFGKFMYNGFGGKVEAGESSAEGALRELQEEAGIEADLDHAGTLLFTSSAGTMLYHIEVFRAQSYRGQITESEEMRPEWFALPMEYRSHPTNEAGSTPSPYPAIPFDLMWADDRLWFDLLLSKRCFIGRVDFGVPTDPDNLNSAPLLKWWFGEILQETVKP